MFTIRKASPYEPTHFERDRDRHRKKIIKLLKENPDLIESILQEEDIVRVSPEKAIKIPVRGLIEYHFVFDERSPRVGQATGVGKGTVVKGGRQASQQGDQGPGAGDTPGNDIYETDVLIKEIREAIDEMLQLPRLEKKAHNSKVPERKKKGFEGIKKVGVQAHLEKRRTARERIKRKKKTR